VTDELIFDEARWVALMAPDAVEAALTYDEALAQAVEADESVAAWLDAEALAELVDVE